MPSKGRKAAITRDAILNAAGWLFKYRGFLKTTTEDIASRAGVSKATVLRYFPNSDYLLYEVLCETVRTGIRAAQSATESCTSPRQKLENIVSTHLKLNMQSDSHGGISIYELRYLSTELRKSYIPLRDEYECLFRNTVQEAMSAGQIKQGDAGVQTRLLLGALNLVPRWFKRSKQDDSLSIEDVEKEACNLIFCYESPKANDND